MKKERLLREYKVLMHKIVRSERLNVIYLDCERSISYPKSIRFVTPETRGYKECMRAATLRYNLPEEQVGQIWLEEFQKYHKLKKKPLGETRDNKRVLNRGNTNHKVYYQNTVRYPCKARSKKTWERFYTLFPHLAKKDNWDGQTSDKMKK